MHRGGVIVQELAVINHGDDFFRVLKFEMDHDVVLAGRCEAMRPVRLCSLVMMRVRSLRQQ